MNSLLQQYLPCSDEFIHYFSGTKWYLLIFSVNWRVGFDTSLRSYSTRRVGRLT